MKFFLTNVNVLKKIANSPKAKNLILNSGWSIAGSFLSKGLLFISWITVARILGQEGYGQFGITRSTVLMFSSFAGLGLGITASKHVSEYIDRDKEKTSRILGLTMSFGILMGVVVGVVFFLLSPWLARYTLEAPEMTGDLQVASIILFFSALNGAQIGALQGFMAFKLIAKINVIHSVISVPLFILGAYHFGVYGTIWALALSYILICVLSNFVLNKQARKHGLIINYKQAISEKSLIFTYSLPAFLSGLMVTPVKWYSDTLLVTNTGLSQLGIFTAALTIHSMLLAGAATLSAPFISIMARNVNNSRNSQFNRFNILAPWAIGIFVAAPFLAMPEIGGLLFGKSYAGESFEKSFIVIMFFSVVIMFKQGLARIMIVHNLQWWSFFSNALWGLLLIVSFSLFSVKESMTLALSYLIAYTVSTVVIIPIYYRKNIIPKKTIDTLESVLIWLSLVSLTIAGYLISNYYVRGLILLLYVIINLYLFNRIFKRKIDGEY